MINIAGVGIVDTARNVDAALRLRSTCITRSAARRR